MKNKTKIFVACDKEKAWQVEYAKKFFTEMIERCGTLTSAYEDKDYIKLESDLYHVTIASRKVYTLGRRFDMVFDYTNHEQYVNECLLPTMSNSKFSKWNEDLLDK